MSGPAETQRRTFYLLGCESCGRFDEPPMPADSHVAQPLTEPMRCADCGDLLLLAECWIADESEMWQERPGAMWHHVAYADRLPRQRSRQVWV